MKGRCHFFIAICALVTPYFSQAVRLRTDLSLQPSFTVSLNKRSVSGKITSNYYLETLMQDGGGVKANGLIYKFINEPFGTVGNYNTDAYLGPGYTYVETSQGWNLKKTGVAGANATSSDTVSGETLTYIGTTSSDGTLFLPIENLVTSESGAYIDIMDITDDGLTSVIKAGTTTASYETVDSKHFLLLADDDTAFTSAKKYVTKTSSEKYYIVLGGSDNNFSTLTGTNFSATDAFEQMDHEFLKYYGITLGLMADLMLQDFVHLNLKLDISTPIEKIEHVGKHIEIHPEADISLKAGITFGDTRGSIGYLYGLTYDRFSATLKKFIADSGAYASLGVYTTDLDEYVFSQEIIANIALNENANAFFSTYLTASDYAVNLEGLNTTAPVLNQRYSAGVSLTY